jgi:hypothetical protein
MVLADENGRRYRVWGKEATMDGRRFIVTRTVFGLLGLVLGVVAGIYAHGASSSWWLALFVGLMVAYALGRAVPDLVTDPQKGRRALFFGMPLLLAVAGVAGAYALWSEWWLAVLIGFCLGGIGAVIATISLPEIAEQEQQDGRARARGDVPQFRGDVPQFGPVPRQPARDADLEALFRAARESGIVFTPDEERRITLAYYSGDRDEIVRLVTAKAA